tara:strand:- start:60 stop:407 length:348 start_codon:yes stop_codon:yes gene_type:complete
MPHSKNKGSSYERKLAKEFRGFGFLNCKTSRFESKMLDDAGVDLTHTGVFNIQAKAVERLSPSYHDILSSMPQNDNNYNLIFHKRNRRGEVVVMKKEDFYDILTMLINTDIINAY